MNEEISLPRWNQRLDALRATGFSDLMPILGAQYKMYEAAVKFLGPYNARQRSSKLPYHVPTRAELQEVIRRGPVNDFVYQSFLSSIIRFCEKTKGLRALPEPHPSTIHNIQLPQSAFIIEGSGAESSISIAGAEEPIVVKGLRLKDPKFIIVRPKLSRLGTASAKEWEVLFFTSAFGYIVEWVDSNLNPKYSGIY